MASIQELRLLAAYDGKTKFDIEVPCKKCGTSTRYVRSNQCVNCTKERAKAGEQKVKDVLESALARKAGGESNG